MTRTRRSMLFIPGNNPGMIQNSTVFGADSIIFDLEDAVNIDEKDAARILVSNAIRTFEFYPTECVVRINPMDTVWGEVDLRRIAQCEPDAILLPKADVKSVQECVAILDEMEELSQLQRGSIKIIVLIESAIGVEMASEIINISPRIEAVLLGAEDLTADLGVSRTLTGREIMYARTRLAVLCKAYNLQFIDTPFVDVNNTEGLIEDIKEAINLGATGKAAINPRQIETIHKGFMPSEEEVKWAKEVIKGWAVASKEGIGVFSLNGKMVDLPVKLRADSILHKVTMN